MKKIILKISIGYQWSKGRISKDQKWLFLRKIAQSAAESIQKKSNQDFQIIVDVSRIRSAHGGIILNEIRQRITKSDVLIFDVEEQNKNVYFELGMALATREESRDVFIFSKSKDSIPSDLQGFLVSYYQETDEYKLIDPQGFNAAIISVLIKKLRENGYICRDDSDIFLETESEEENQSKNQV